MKSVCPVKVKINCRSGGGYRGNQRTSVVLTIPKYILISVKFVGNFMKHILHVQLKYIPHIPISLSHNIIFTYTKFLNVQFILIDRYRKYFLNNKTKITPLDDLN